MKKIYFAFVVCSLLSHQIWVSSFWVSTSYVGCLVFSCLRPLLLVRWCLGVILSRDSFSSLWLSCRVLSFWFDFLPERCHPAPERRPVVSFLSAVFLRTGCALSPCSDFDSHVADHASYLSICFCRFVWHPRLVESGSARSDLISAWFCFRQGARYQLWSPSCLCCRTEVSLFWLRDFAAHPVLSSRSNFSTRRCSSRKQVQRPSGHFRSSVERSSSATGPKLLSDFVSLLFCTSIEDGVQALILPCWFLLQPCLSIFALIYGSALCYETPFGVVRSSPNPNPRSCLCAFKLWFLWLVDIGCRWKTVLSWVIGSKISEVFFVSIALTWWFLKHARKLFSEMTVRT
jgi:hypothetical protein